MALDPGFVAGCPYGPRALLIDDIVHVDRETSTVVASMPVLGFAHVYYVLDLRRAEGWIGYGTHIHEGRFGEIGPAILLTCSAASVRKIRNAIVARYSFRFEQNGELVYEGDQSAIFTCVEA